MDRVLFTGLDSVAIVMHVGYHLLVYWFQLHSESWVKSEGNSLALSFYMIPSIKALTSTYKVSSLLLYE
jgi:uncharacterized membrane protein YdjX (TVP38/TMEM64 family)